MTIMQIEQSSGGPVTTLQLVTNPPSGFPIVVLQATPSAMTQLNWDAQGPSNVLVLAPAGHRPGIYLVTAPVLIKETQGAGILHRSISFSAPGVGATSIENDAAGDFTVPGMTSGDVTQVISDGTAAITVQFTPLGATPPVLADIYAAASLHGLIAGP